jgi:hypothetical protein
VSVKSERSGVSLTISPLSVSRLSRKCESHDNLQTYEQPLPVTQIDYLSFTVLIFVSITILILILTDCINIVQHVSQLYKINFLSVLHGRHRKRSLQLMEAVLSLRYTHKVI